MSHRIAVVTALVGLTACGESLNTTGPDHSGNISGHEVWSSDLNPHVITSATTISGTVTVTEGTIIQVADGAELVVTGGLDVQGTAEDAVIFEAKGSGWAGIRVAGGTGSTAFMHTVIDGAGSAVVGALDVQASPIRVENLSITGSSSCGLALGPLGRLHAESHDLSITGSASYAVCADVNAVQTVPLEGQDFVDSGTSGILLTGQDLTGSHTWANRGDTYILSEGLSIYEGFLTVQAGVTLQMASGASVVVGDSAETDPVSGLVTLGTAEAPVVFTGAGGSPGAWAGLSVMGGVGEGAVSLNHTLIEYGGDTDAALIVADNSLVAVDNLTISGSLNAGMWVTGGGGFTADSTSLVVMQSGSSGLMAPNSVATLPGDSDLSGNTEDLVYLEDTSVQTSGTWRNLGASYQTQADLDIKSVSADPVVLTLNAGVDILFADDAVLQVGAQGTAGLVALGESGNPVTLSGVGAGAGSWNGLDLRGGAIAGLTELTWLEISEAGSENNADALDLNGGNALVSDVLISDSLGYGFRVRGGVFAEGSRGLVVTGNGYTGLTEVDATASVPSLDSVYTGNSTDAVFVDGARIEGVTEWEDLGVPYRVDSVLSIGGGSDDTITPTLTLTEGVTVEFESGAFVAETRNLIAGALHLLGTAEAPVVLTSVGGAPGDWTGVSFEAAAASTVQHAEIGFGGLTSANLRIEGCTPTVANVLLHDSMGWGLYAFAVEDAANVDFGTVTYAGNLGGDYNAP